MLNNAIRLNADFFVNYLSKFNIDTAYVPLHTLNRFLDPEIKKPNGVENE